MVKTNTASAVIFSLVLLISFASHLACDKGVEPPVVKDPREYSWTVDTVYYPNLMQTMISTVWGSSSQDVYMTGRTSGSAPIMLRFDGKRFKEVIFPYPQDGFGFFDFFSIFGFNSANIWVIGGEWFFNPSPPPNYFDSSGVIHFNGSTWEELKLKPRGRNLSAIWGRSQDDFWIAGGKSLWHFDGFGWTNDTIPIVTPQGSFYATNWMTGDNDGNVYLTFYMRPIASQARESYYFLKRSEPSWKIVDSAEISPQRTDKKWGYSRAWTSPLRQMYSSGDGIYKWDGTIWKKIFESSSANIGQVFGTDDANIFVVGGFGTVLHYNGQNWFRFTQFDNPDMIYTGVWTDGTEAFVVGYTLSGQKSIILHGK